MIALLLLLLGPPAAQAQQPACGYGLGLQALASADADLTPLPGSLSEGRAQANRASRALATAHRQLLGCGCPRLAEAARDASALAELALSEAGVPALRLRLDRAHLAIEDTRRAAGRQGCH